MQRTQRKAHIVERMQADAIALAEAGGVEAGDELADDGAGLAGRDGAGGVEGVDVDLEEAQIRVS